LPVAFGLSAASAGGVGLHRRYNGIACFGLLAGLVLADGQTATFNLEVL